MAVAVGVVLASRRWPQLAATVGIPESLPFLPASKKTPAGDPLLELAKLVAAAVLGTVVTAVHKHYHREKPLSRSLAQAQVLLCVSGAMMMIIIGDSFARALGIAGGASIIRFRTPVENPKDAVILFLLLGLGMSCGTGAFGVAGLAAAFLCVCLAVLEHVGESKPRVMKLELVARGQEFPTRRVEGILARFGIAFEPREIVHGGEAMVSYQVKFSPSISLEDLTAELINGADSGLKSVAWASSKKRG